MLLYNSIGLIELDTEKRLALDAAIRRFVVEDLQPLSVVESPAFRNLFQTFNLDYKPMCTETLKSQLAQIHLNHHQKVKF